MCRFVTSIILAIGSSILVSDEVASFVPASGIATLRNEVNNNSIPRCGAIFAEAADDSSEDGDDDATATTALPPATDTSDDGATDKSNEIDTPTEAAPAVATAALFINQQTKRILIEELGYRRAEVERLRPELAQPLVEKRTFRPSEGMPEEWMMAEEDTTRAMLDKLESENRYPLKFPLLAIGTILFGKGFGDALITLIKVNIDFPGANLTEEFLGVPVLAIDAACVVAGAALASWTWNTMKD